MTNFPLLSIITLLPTVGAVIILLLPAERKTEARLIAAATTFFAMALSFWTYFSYNVAAGGYQFQEQIPWIPALNASYHLGANGLSLPMVLLTGVVSFTGVLISWGIEDRPREFFAFLLLLVTGVYGVFVALDLLLLAFFYELAVFPMYLLIAIWGWKVSRKYAAMKLTLYLLVGSLVALVGILAMYYTANPHTFDILALEKAGFTADFQKLWFLPIFLGFAVLAGLWPFHSWSPDGHVAAPTAVSMLHAGVLMKVGAYAALRVGIMLLPDGARYWMPLVLILTVVNVVYGAFIALVQTDFKYVIGFSSVSHMGMVSMGFATLNEVGMSGATLQMFSHGVMTALFFAVVGMVYDRTHTRQIPELGGLGKILPLPALGFIIGGFVSMGLPGFSGFWAEFQIFSGLWAAREMAVQYPVIAAISVLGVLITAAYVLRVVRNVFFGPLAKPEYGTLAPINTLDKIAIVLLCTILIGIGLFPMLISNMIASGVSSVLALLGGA